MSIDAAAWVAVRMWGETAVLVVDGGACVVGRLEGGKVVEVGRGPTWAAAAAAARRRAKDA